MKSHLFDSWHLPPFLVFNLFRSSVRENIKYFVAFAIGLPLAVAGAAYLIDAMVTMLVQ